MVYAMATKGQVSAWCIGWAAAKANALPMAVLWCLVAATMAAYYLVSATSRYGGFEFVSMAIKPA